MPVPNPPITIYSKPACVQCTATLRLLTKLGAVEGTEFRIVDMSADPDALDMVRGLGYLAAPVVVVTTPDGGTHWSGFKDDKVKAAVERVRAEAAVAA